VILEPLGSFLARRRKANEMEEAVNKGGTVGLSESGDDEQLAEQFLAMCSGLWTLQYSDAAKTIMKNEHLRVDKDGRYYIISPNKP
jgi:hypothetical protein